MKQPLEIERKFLVEHLPQALSGYPHHHIRQGYVAVDDDGTVVRLRQMGEQYFQTIKGRGDLVRVEIEIDLTQAQFASLWPATVRRRIEKVRYMIPHGPHCIELDVYWGPLEGLFTAEVEFTSLAAAEAYVPPDWFGEDVSQDARYRNLFLATEGIPCD